MARMFIALFRSSLAAGFMAAASHVVPAHSGENLSSASGPFSIAPIGSQPVAAGLPQGISDEAWAGIQKQIAQSQYEMAASATEPETVSARNLKQGLELNFSRNGAVIRSLRGTESGQPGNTELLLRTLSVGRGNRQIAAATISPVADAARIEYRHDGWTEWFINSAAGLEHGYRLQQRPGASGPRDEPIRIAVAVSGMRAKANDDGSLNFTTVDGRNLRYEKLSVVDADHHPLQASLSAPADDRIEITFDDTGARYPVTVDPLLVNEAQRTDNPGGPDLNAQAAGTSLALDGGTLLVGAPAALGYGAVYVFTKNGDSWNMQQRLTAVEPQADENFGISVALSGDTALIGAEYSDTAVSGNTGAAYVFTRSGEVWAQQARLLGSGQFGAFFGHAVAVSGDTALIGAYKQSVGSVAPGAAYVFTRSGGSWTQQSVLTANDGADADFFGFSVALVGDTALVGAYGAFVTLSDDGKVYVFARSGTSWKQRTKLQAPHPRSDQFGYSIALSGDTALIGAPNRPTTGSYGQGAAYVFVGADKNWSLQAELVDADGVPGDQFGSAVTIEADTAIVSSPGDVAIPGSGKGSALAFARSGSSWTLQSKMLATGGDASGSAVALSGDTALVGSPYSNAISYGYPGRAEAFTRSGATWTAGEPIVAPAQAATFDQLGFAVAVNGNTALVGVPFDDVGDNPLQGSVYVFRQTEGSWLRQAVLTAADGATEDHFGSSVALDGDIALIGAANADAAAGAAFVFVRVGEEWAQQIELVAAVADANDRFGSSLALSGDTALVGAPGAGQSRGSAYVFLRSGSSWTQQTKLVADDGVSGDGFGTAVSLAGDTALVGAAYDDVGSQQDQGSAYVFLRSGKKWSQQAHLVDTAGGADDCFGLSTALSGDTALVGSPGSDLDPDHKGLGAGFVYVRSGAAWPLQAKLQASKGTGGDQFGHAVGLSGDTALIGASRCANCKQKQGAAYVYVRAAGHWAAETRLVDSNAVPDDAYGTAVAVSGTSIVVGAYGDDVPEGKDGGSVHFFRIGVDYGDAPAPYPTLLADSGARHFINTDGPRLGANEDAEADGQPNSGATGDDINGKSDEDGVSFGKLYAGKTTDFTVTISAADGTAQLDAWIDFNADGDWSDDGEQICKACLVNAGSNTLTVAVPSSAKIGQTYARFRVSPAGTGKVKVSDRVIFGEVEDYLVKIKAPN